MTKLSEDSCRKEQQQSRALECPAGKTLPYVRQSRKRGRAYEQYQAAGSDCESCPLRARCCPKRRAGDEWFRGW